MMLAFLSSMSFKDVYLRITSLIHKLSLENVEDIDTFCSFATFSEKETLSKVNCESAGHWEQNLPKFTEGEAPLCDQLSKTFSDHTCLMVLYSFRILLV